MVMTEDEAKTKWCPFTRTGMYAGSSAVAVNRHVLDAKVHDETRCTASGCMAWRWSPVGLQMHFDDKGPHLRHPTGGEPTGYCGLAGEPNP